MKTLLHVAIILLCTALGFIESVAAGFTDETLHYVVTYKWGLIHKEAGDATLSLREAGNDYRLMLTARSRPWADRIFMVRDTLTSTVGTTDLRPHRYTRIAHEGGKYSRDDITFSYSGSAVSGHAVRHRINKKGEKSQSEISLKATGPTFDMLSVFYFLRTLDYSSLAKGNSVKANIFSGKLTETLTIRCISKETIERRDKEKTRVEAWHIRFRFTSGGGKKSSDDIDAWISADGRHIPLRIFGNLPLGQIRVYLKP
ncbi:MAG: DUF3108 domain-containing protein [Muribaculaceae bacterium]|nr:DUF3108 domain-containing protein [Muribaculaceae bacterium]